MDLVTVTLFRRNTRMDFRLAEPRDAQDIASLHARSWQVTYRGMMPDAYLDGPVIEERIAAWQARLNDPRVDRFTCVAVEVSRIVGFVCAVADDDDRWGSLIDNLHVAPERHRSGIGRTLLCQAARWLTGTAPRQGVYLWVMVRNAPARSFYDRLGARPHDTRRLLDPSGGSALNCRYVWSDPQALADTAQLVTAPA
jgi:ribosomal protein S18 acetylase RimI-like enzyme